MLHGHFHLVIIFIHQVKHPLMIHTKIVDNKIFGKEMSVITFFVEFTSASNLETIARTYSFEPLYATNEKQPRTKPPIPNANVQWMNAGVLFTDKTIDPDFNKDHRTGLSYFKKLFIKIG